MSYRAAKVYRRRFKSVQSVIDRAFSFGADRLPLCGNGRRHNWSVMIADAFFVNCPCCIFWRGVVVGFGLCAATGALIWGIF